jgi:hypothetical protein
MIGSEQEFSGMRANDAAFHDLNLKPLERADPGGTDMATAIHTDYINNNVTGWAYSAVLASVLLSSLSIPAAVTSSGAWYRRTRRGCLRQIPAFSAHGSRGAVGTRSATILMFMIIFIFTMELVT